MRKRTRISIILLGIIIPALLFGCAGKKEKGLKTIQGNPETLYKDGLVRFNKRQYSDALKKFEQLKSSFPDSPPFTTLAELKIADSHFFKKDYVEAAAAYEEFKKVHPTHEEIAYVQYQIGMSYFNQMLTLDRDQSFTRKALSSFEFLAANSPPSLFTEKAREKIGVCKKRLADHEFSIGEFYYRHEKYQAAASRFESLLGKFPRIADEDRTLLFLGKSYLQLDRREKAKEALAKIVDEYPKSPHYKEAKTVLNRGMKGKKPSSQKAGVKKTDEAMQQPGSEGIVLVKYDEELRKAASIKDEGKIGEGKTEEGKTEEGKTEEGKTEGTPLLPVAGEEAKPMPLNGEGKQLEGLPSSGGPTGEEKTKAVPEEAKPEGDLKIALLPGEEARKGIAPAPSTIVEPKAETKKTGKEDRKPALPGVLASAKRKEKSDKGILEGLDKEGKLVDNAHPIDITSDSVETYSKENLIVFKGNVMARQKDMVIYADSIEAVIVEDGKGIEKVIAGGNVKIQQGLRIASSRKAIFYNLEKRVVLTGEPKVWEGEDMVSGDEIVFDIERNRVEVKGGPEGRGKAKIQPKEETEKRE